MYNKDLCIEQVNEPEEKAEIVKEVLCDLPEWFGLPESTKEYVEQSKTLPLFVARNRDRIFGFITLQATSEVVCEIHCMGIKKKDHRKGIGYQLYDAFEQFAKENYEFVQVKTVDEGRYDEYDHTIAFYKKIGFQKMEVFPTLWDEWNPCLILIKKIPH